MGVVREHPLTDVMAECDGEIRCDCLRGIDFFFISFALLHFLWFLNQRTHARVTCVRVCVCVYVWVGGGCSGGLLRFLRFKDDHHTDPPWDFFVSLCSPVALKKGNSSRTDAEAVDIVYFLSPSLHLSLPLLFCSSSGQRFKIFWSKTEQSHGTHRKNKKINKTARGEKSPNAHLAVLLFFCFFLFFNYYYFNQGSSLQALFSD